uniref:Uncharacterized protein n=1 Tax=Arundo donax TaxID=35708 RepID=A0A0A9DYM0_ARUDO
MQFPLPTLFFIVKWSNRVTSINGRRPNLAICSCFCSYILVRYLNTFSTTIKIY